MPPGWSNPLDMGGTRDERRFGEVPERRSDRDLVLDFREGCPVAYESIYLRHYERVYRTCLKILSNPADAAEATQETFLKAFKALGRFNGQYHLGAWLARIANNVALDQLRARARSVNIAAGTDEVIDLEDEHRGPAMEVAERVGVAEALEEIQPLHAQALMLQAVEGLSHKQIAARLQMSSSQVKSLLHRSRSSFKKAWDNASGWALAPLALARGRGAKEASTNPLVVASPATSMFFERIAASAMAAVVAVTGFATDPGDWIDPPRERVPREVEVTDVPDDELDGPKGALADDGAEEAPVTELDKAKAEVAELLAVERVLNNDLEEEPDDPDDDSDDPRLPTSSKKPLPKEARKAVKEVKEVLGHEGDPTASTSVRVSPPPAY